MGWVVLIVVVVALYLLFRREEEENHQRAVAEAQETFRARQEATRLRAYVDGQKKTFGELISLNEDSVGSLEKMPKYLSEAESALDRAEKEFKDGAFAPFWDAIEDAMWRLGRFDGCIEDISTNSKRYVQLAKSYDGPPPKFPIGSDAVKSFAVSDATSERLKTLVRQGQRNFQFAMIFEQRKTNQVLVAGFTSLAQAIDGMGRRISGSINELSNQVSDLSSKVSDMSSNIYDLSASLEESFQALGEHHQEFIEELRDNRLSVEKQQESNAERQEKALEMLDNIQRRRIPLPRQFRDGGY